MLNTFYSSPLSSGFQRLADAPSLSRLRGAIPAIQLDKPFDPDVLSNVKDKVMIDAYFNHYGFDVLLERYSKVSYYFGSISLRSQTTFSLATHVWRPVRPQACVFVAHGLFDHVGLYLQLVDYLLQHNYSVVAIDFPGHGLSSGPVGSIKDFKDYALAVNEVRKFIIKNENKLLIDNESFPLPCFAVGQSTGCAALMRYLFLGDGIDNKLFTKVALLAPLVRPKSWWSVFASYLMLSKFVSSLKRTYTKNSHNIFFTDFVAKYDPLQPRRVSVEWVGAMVKWIKSFHSFSGQSVSVLIVQGTGDGTVDFNYNIPAIKKKFSNVEVQFVPEAKHHFVNESDALRLKGFLYVKEFFSN